MNDFRAGVEAGVEAETDVKLAEAKNAFQMQSEQVGILSSEYFQLIPQRGFVFEEIRPLSKLAMLLPQISLVENLLDYDISTRMLMGAKYRENEMNPLDYVYRSVGCQIQLMGEEEEEAQYILRYIMNTKEDARIESIYRVQRPGEQARMEQRNVGNRRLLFHGSGVGNLLSILHKGLVTSQSTGLQFSDRFSDAVRHCTGHADDSTRFMLLCEVALGNFEAYTGHGRPRRPQDGHDSLYFVGTFRPFDQHNVQLKTGCLVPLGRLVEKQPYKGVEANCYRVGYTVFDEAQVCMRYLIQYRQ